MPMPATHIIFNCAIFYPFRKYLGKYWLVFAILSGMLADLDFISIVFARFFGMSFGVFGHGGFFHSVGFILFLLGIIFIIYAKNKEFGTYGFVLSIGVLFHILLDYILGGGANYLMLFYPFSEHLFRIHLLEQFRDIEIYGILDAIIIFYFTIWIYFKIKKEKDIKI